MSKKIQLTIPTPCHENWENMLPADKGKFCQSCSKEVIDFTAMSDSQLVAFFKKPSTGSVCGRFQDYQLDRQIIEPRKKLPWLKYFFQFALPAFLISSRAYTQGEVKGKVAAVCSSEVKGDTIAVVPVRESEKNKRIKGVVRDKDGNPIAGSSIYVKGTNMGTAADATGNFTLNFDTSKNLITLVISSVGFITVEKNIELTMYKSEDIVLTQLDYAVMGDIVIAGMVTPVKKKSIPLIEKIFRDTAFGKFSIYPNPASPATSVTIKYKKLNPGNYTIELQNQSGQVVNIETIRLSEFQRSIPIKIPQIIPGIYFVKISSDKLKAVYTEKIIIR